MVQFWMVMRCKHALIGAFLGRSTMIMYNPPLWKPMLFKWVKALERLHAEHT